MSHANRRIPESGDGVGGVEIRAGVLSYRALLRCIREAGAVITHTMHDPLNDHTEVGVRFRDANIYIETPFSDYIISCASPGEAFEAFIAKLEARQVKWWERFI